MEQHRQNPTCANCHAKMDPLGFAFENFDAIGALPHEGRRVRRSTRPASCPTARSSTGPAELKAILKDKKELFARCLAEKMLTYALGRGLEYYDQPAVDRDRGRRWRANDYKFSALVAEIVKSDPFRMRRGKDSSEP